MPRSQLDSPRKNHIIGTIRAGASIKHAAALEKAARQTAQSIWQKWLETGSTSNRPQSGRRHKLDGMMHAILVHHAATHRFMPLKHLAKRMGIGRHLVRRELAMENLHRRRVRRCLKRTAVQEARRHIWAGTYQGWGMDQWRNIMFSDESYLCVDGNLGNIWVTRRPHKEYERSCTIERPSQSPLRIMVWGCIAHNYKGPLVILDYPGGRGGGMTSARYQEQVLQPVLIPAFNRLCSERPDLQFQQDNARCHTARATSQCLQENNIPQFPHPPISPDVNPIEPVWFDWKNIFRGYDSVPETKEELIRAAQQAWDALTIEQINKQIESMPKRVAAVVFAEGGNTGY